MAKDPAFLFYSQDFIVGVQTMPFEDRGKYITILCQMHQQGRMDEETIRFMVGSISDKLRLKFKVDENGFWYNERLELETEKRNHFTETRRQNGNLGGRPKKDKPIGKPTENHKGNLMGNEDEIEIEDWLLWGKSIVEKSDQHWEQMMGRHVSQAEMDDFLSVATRNKWTMDTQQAFRTTLKGFKSNGTAVKEVKRHSKAF